MSRPKPPETPFPIMQPLFCRHLDREHLHQFCTFWYLGSQERYTRRCGEIVHFNHEKQILTLKVVDKETEYKSFRMDRIPHDGAIAIF